ncbi:hypothetical protein CRUP_032892 [Coryphaenoides rupestris]|nr:hypothetical protein CRUP_032892 [Coryphaenoides rupestris]
MPAEATCTSVSCVDEEPIKSVPSSTPPTTKLSPEIAPTTQSTVEKATPTPSPIPNSPSTDNTNDNTTITTNNYNNYNHCSIYYNHNHGVLHGEGEPPPVTSLAVPFSSPRSQDLAGTTARLTPTPESSQLVDRASLLAVLLFGSLFFLVTVAVFAMQALESYRRKDYTQVDYLINGMYTDSGV